MKKILFGFFVVGVIALLIFIFFYYKNQSTNVPQFNKEILVSPSPTPFSIMEAPSESLRGKLTILQNEVKWQDRIATESSKITEGIKIQQGEKVETNDSGKALLKFDDVLEINILPNSTLNIIQTLPIDLVFSLGKGTINIERLGNNSISLRVKHLLAKISGSADISLDEEGSLITLVATKGSVDLAYNSLVFVTKTYKISEGESIVFNDSTRKVVAK